MQHLSRQLTKGNIMKTNKVTITIEYEDGSSHSIDADIYKDGDKWCCMIGENIQEGIAGFGDRPDKAISSLQREIGFYR